jgi:hypothetical protein
MKNLTSKKPQIPLLWTTKCSIKNYYSVEICWSLSVGNFFANLINWINQFSFNMNFVELPLKIDIQLSTKDTGFCLFNRFFLFPVEFQQEMNFRKLQNFFHFWISIYQNGIITTKSNIDVASAVNVPYEYRLLNNFIDWKQHN